MHLEIFNKIYSHIENIFKCSNKHAILFSEVRMKRAESVQERQTSVEGMHN